MTRKKSVIQHKQGPEKRIKGKPDPVTITFSLKHVQDGKWCFSKLHDTKRASVAKALWKRRTFSWSEIQFNSKKALGSEKISSNAIKATKPRHITTDVSFYFGLLYHEHMRMVGYFETSVFYVLWFDDGKLYDHGS